MMQAAEPLRIHEILSSSAEFLAHQDVENPRLNAERLLAKAIGCDRTGLYLRADGQVMPHQLQAFYRDLNRRALSEPLQHLLGETEFMSLPFRVNGSVLIPRPETEILVESIIKHIQGRDMVHPVILDAGTGSGCVAISLVHFLTSCEVFAIDVSGDALATAKQNSEINQTAAYIKFAQVDIWGTILVEENQGGFDAIASNPPYISQDEYCKLPTEVRGYEPRIALSDDDDGLTFYRRFAKIAPLLLKANGFLALEIGANQAASVIRILDKSFSRIEIFKDLNGLDRVVIAENPT